MAADPPTPGSTTTGAPNAGAAPTTGAVPTAGAAPNAGGAPSAGAAPNAGGAPSAGAAPPTLLKPNPGPFKKDQKRYDPLSRPFHRLNSRTYDAQVDVGSKATTAKVSPSGKGRDCGCRNSSDFKSSILGNAIVGALIDGLELAVTKAIPGAKEVLDKLKEQLKNRTGRDFEQELKDLLSKLIESGLFGGFLKFIPSWVPVNRIGYGPQFDDENAHNVVNGREAEVEVQGRLSRSYQTHHHRPYTQWSHHYHWAFHVDPMPGYRHLLGKFNDTTEDEVKLEGEARTENRTRAIEVYQGSRAHLECLLDVGAFSSSPIDSGRTVLTHPAIFYDKSWPFWPQSGDWFWAAGRFVYDCTHAIKVAPKKDEDDRHSTLINPVKAFASARYEAQLFEESDEPITVVRFSFFACAKGGYVNFDGKLLPFKDENYEFAVDLPPAPSGDVQYEVGQVSDFALNTLVIRPRLLQKIEFAPYRAGFDSPLRWHQESPVIQIVQPADGSLPRMVKLTIPMKDIPDKIDGYGFTLSMGWLSPGASTGVKKVTVKIPQITFLEEREDLRLSICVNGRMIFFPTTKPSKVFAFPNDSIQGFPDTRGGIVLLLPPEKSVVITASGMQRFGFGQFLEEKKTVDFADQSKDRRLAVGGVINVDPETEKKIKELLEKKLGDIVPPELLGKFKKLQQQLDDDNFRKLLNQAVSDLVGQRRIVVWENDVDFVEADGTRKNEIACAVAREMAVFPVEKLNKPNAPKGFLDFNPFSADTIPDSQFNVLSVRAMQQRLAIEKDATTTMEFRVRHCVQASDSGFIVFQVNRIDDDDDYLLKITATIADPDPPA
jgi:hypothetical protein